MKSIFRAIMFSALLIAINTARAATIEGIISKVKDVLLKVVSLLIIVGTVVFMWGIIRYISAGDDETKVEEGRNLIIFGLIGLAVMVSVWGLVKIIADTFGIGGESIPLIN